MYSTFANLEWVIVEVLKNYCRQSFLYIYLFIHFDRLSVKQNMNIKQVLYQMK